MNFWQIAGKNGINETDQEKVEEIKKSILEKGWVGCPILIMSDELLTGSHRLEALKQLADYEGDEQIEDRISEILDDDGIAVDVTDIANENYQKFYDKNGYYPEIEYDRIGWLLEGSWVEEYEEELEW